jgi:hypothetical protein
VLARPSRARTIENERSSTSLVRLRVAPTTRSVPPVFSMATPNVLKRVLILDVSIVPTVQTSRAQNLERITAALEGLEDRHLEKMSKWIKRFQ